MAGLVPAIHVFLCASKAWMPATSAGMTAERYAKNGSAGFRMRRGATICEDDAAFKGEKLKAEALHREPPEPLGRLQHDHNGNHAQHDQVDGTQVSQELAQQEEHQRADDRPFDAADAADHRDEDHEGGPVIDAEGSVG